MGLCSGGLIPGVMPRKQSMRRNIHAGAILILLLCLPAYSQQRRQSLDPFHDFVTALPPVDKVEVLTVTPLQTDEVNKVDCTRSDLVCVHGRFPLQIGAARTLTGEAARGISELWRNLKRGKRVRCFSTTHVLRFYRGDKLLLETEVCIHCHNITLPDKQIVSISGSMEALYRLQDLLLPDTSSKQRFENFKREMISQVGQQITIIGVLESAKLGGWVAFREWGLYIRSTKNSDIPNMNDLYRLECQTIKVSGTLRYFPEPVRTSSGPVTEAVAPEHFYLDVAEIKVISLAPPRSKKNR